MNVLFLSNTKIIMRFREVALTVLIVLLLCGPAPAARVLFYQADPGNPDIEARLELACRFYGITLERRNAAASDLDAVNESVAVVIEADVLNSLVPGDLPANRSALLITGMNSRTSPEVLRAWVKGDVQAERRAVTNQMNQILTVEPDKPDLAFELDGQKLPVDIREGYSLSADAGTPIISYVDGRPLFIETGSSAQPVYLLADLDVVYPPDSSIWFFDRGFFAEIAPYMMFLKKTFGEVAWHTDGDYANLTIDDPWLCDSYGNLNFAELLREMDRADFHTTIAYIPWNYDRPSSPDALEIFRSRPDRFSLCMHGNNHDHREFYSYALKPGAKWPARPLAEQDADIRQGMARIEKFEQISGLSVDPVLVFPHGNAPDQTLELLKKYNFRATSNVGYDPLDTPFPDDPLFWLRQVTDRFGGGLASLDRAESANLTAADVAIDLFLDNPVLFVEHLRFFSDSRAAFNSFARQVNELQPAVEWVGLGELTEHLYLMRREEDGDWLVHTFSPDIILNNPDSEPRQYRVLKVDDGKIPVRQILENGQETGVARNSDGHLQMDVTVPSQQQRRIQIVFENDFVAKNEDLGESNLRINLLRHLSDIRDRYLIAGPLGALINRYYYDSNLYKFGLKALLAVAATGLLIFVVLIGFIIRRRKKRHD